jgi:hypothetical protein
MNRFNNPLILATALLLFAQPALSQTKNGFELGNALVPSAELRDESGNLLPAIRAFWFAWYTFHPDTDVFEAD